MVAEQQRQQLADRPEAADERRRSRHQTGHGGRADRVGERADAVDLELDGLAGLDPAVELEAAAAGHRPGRDHVAGVELLAGATRRRASRRACAAGRRSCPRTTARRRRARGRSPAVQSGSASAVTHVAADRVGERLRLDDRAEDVAPRVVGLHVAGAPVVEDEPAADGVQRLLGRRVDERLGQHARELELEVEELRVRGPPHVLAVGEHRGVVGDVERRRLAEAVVRLELRERLAGHPLERRDRPSSTGAGKKFLTSIRLEAITCDSHSMNARIERGRNGSTASETSAGSAPARAVCSARDRVLAPGEERQQVVVAGQAGPIGHGAGPRRSGRRVSFEVSWMPP